MEKSVRNTYLCLCSQLITPCPILLPLIKPTRQLPISSSSKHLAVRKNACQRSQHSLNGVKSFAQMLNLLLDPRGDLKVLFSQWCGEVPEEPEPKQPSTGWGAKLLARTDITIECREWKGKKAYPSVPTTNERAIDYKNVHNNLTSISAQCEVSLNMTSRTGRPGTRILSHDARALTLVSFGNAVGFNTRFRLCGPSTRSWICSWHSKNSTRSASHWDANENVITRKGQCLNTHDGTPESATCKDWRPVMALNAFPTADRVDQDHWGSEVQCGISECRTLAARAGRKSSM